MDLHTPITALWAHAHVPPPVPSGPSAPTVLPIRVPTPERTPPTMGDPLPEPRLTIHVPGVIKPPQAVRAKACMRRRALAPSTHQQHRCG